MWTMWSGSTPSPGTEFDLVHGSSELWNRGMKEATYFPHTNIRKYIYENAGIQPNVVDRDIVSFTYLL